MVVRKEKKIDDGGGVTDTVRHAIILHHEECDEGQIKFNHDIHKYVCDYCFESHSKVEHFD